MIDTSQRMIGINSQQEELGGGINHAMERHLLGIRRRKIRLEIQWSGDMIRKVEPVGFEQLSSFSFHRCSFR
jgi:hypothetical protein